LVERIIDGWTRLCLGYRKTILVVLAAITALTVSQLPKARFDNAVEVWFVDDDPALLAHRRLLSTFGSDELVVAGIEADDVFAPELLAKVDRVTRAIEQAPHVEKVFSLTNIESITGANDMLEVGELIEQPIDPETLPATRRRALANELYVGNVVSADGRFTVVIARLPHYDDQFDYKVEAVTAIREILDREFGDAYYLSGGPALDEQFYLSSEKDTVRSLTLMMAFMVVVLWLLLHSVAGVAVTLLTVLGATTWTIGLMILLDVRVNVVTTMLPPLLVAVGVANTMHVLVEYQSYARRSDDRLAAMGSALRDLLEPLFLTTLTTAIGMLSLVLSRVAAIREFGWFAAFGVVAAFVLTVTFVPISMSYLPLPPERHRTRSNLLSERFLDGLHHFTMKHSRPILVIAALLIVGAVAAATQVRAESSFLAIFKPTAKVRIDTEKIQDELGGTVTLEVMVDTGRDGGVKDPEVLRKLADLEAFLESQPTVSSAQSIAGYFKDLRRAFFDNDQREYRLPETREEAAQYLLLYEMDAPDGDIREYVTFDYRETRVTARVALASSNASVEVVQKTEEYLAGAFPQGMTGTIAGISQLYANMEEYIRESLLQGFGSAFIGIFIVFCLQLRSVLLGTIVMIPHLMPIVITLGIMGLTGIRLDSTTAMVASVAIGLADDDSIHYVSRVGQKLKGGADMVTALREALVEVGRALFYTSIALCAGFGVMLTSSFTGAVYFGMLVMITMILALVADLLVLPVMLRWYDPKPSARTATQADAAQSCHSPGTPFNA
jgi:hypothetical protein